MILQTFQTVGKDLFIAGLNNSHSGNISIRANDDMVITRSGAMLHHLAEPDLITTALAHRDENAKIASSEYPVHKAIYQATNAQSVVHAHCPHLVALSFLQNHFTPIDAEGLYYFPAGVPVVAVTNPIASDEVAHFAAQFLLEYAGIVVRGHGLFAAGETLYSAYQKVSSLEHSAKISFIYNNFKLLEKE